MHVQFQYSVYTKADFSPRNIKIVEVRIHFLDAFFFFFFLTVYFNLSILICPYRRCSRTFVICSAHLLALSVYCTTFYKQLLWRFCSVTEMTFFTIYYVMYRTSFSTFFTFRGNKMLIFWNFQQRQQGTKRAKLQWLCFVSKQPHLATYILLSVGCTSLNWGKTWWFSAN